MRNGIYRNSRSLVAHDQETQQTSRTAADPRGSSTPKSKEELKITITAAEKQSITAEHRVSLVYAA